MRELSINLLLKNEGNLILILKKKKSTGARYTKIFRIGFKYLNFEILMLVFKSLYMFELQNNFKS